MSSVHARTILNLSSSLTSLRLRECGLQGQFPATLLLLPLLQELDLSSNSFNSVSSLPYSNSSTPAFHNLMFLALTDVDLSSQSIGFVDFVGNLKSLRSLTLRNCSLGGQITSVLSNFSQLMADVDLSTNNLNGPIPMWLCNMTQLSSLSLSYNELEGPLPSCLFALPSLEFLYLDHNNLEGQIPASLSQYVNLVGLDLSSNNLSASLDFDMFYNFNKLQYLNFSSNNMISSISTPDINLTYYSLPNLKILDLSSCNLNQFPSFLRALGNLTRLDISNNKIQGPIPSWISNVGRLTLSDINLSGNFLTSLGQLQWENIGFIDFHSNLLQGPLPIPPTTTWFFLASNNSLTGEISSLICNLTSLRVFDLSHNHFSGSIPQCLGNMSGLSVLNLGMNKLHGTIPNTFKKDINLNYLVLNDNQFKGTLPQSLEHCQSLQVLDVGNNMIHDEFPHWLEILPKLEVLVLRSNHFVGSINDFKSRMMLFPNLRILDISHNNLTGRLPIRMLSNLEAMMKLHEWFGNGVQYMEASNSSDRGSIRFYSMVITVKGSELGYEKILKTLATLDLSRNKFEGEIPASIGKLDMLHGLNLSHNLLTGHIPPSMGDLVSLEWLDLSSNKLTGHIPRELAEITSLEVLDLSHNQLDGLIPQGKQFNTFENVSYKDNPRLCGFPLSKACDPSEQAPTNNAENAEDPENGFNWEAAFMGYGCGIIFGLSMGYIVFSTGSPKWLVRMVEGKQQHIRATKRSKRNARRRN